MTGRDREIDRALGEITGKSGGARIELDRLDQQLSVRNILLVSTAYDYFLLEEEGRLSDLFRRVYGQRELGYVPMIKHVASGERALGAIEGGWVDLLVVFNPPGDVPLLELAKRAKEKDPDLKVVYLANNTPELARMAASGECTGIDRIFTWHGDGKIFLAIVQAMEDGENYGPDSTAYGTRGILVHVPSLTRLSGLLPPIYDEIWEHTDALLSADLAHVQKLTRVRRRPKVVLADSQEQLLELAKKHDGRILCAIVDETGGARAAEALAAKVPVLAIRNGRHAATGEGGLRTVGADSPASCAGASGRRSCRSSSAGGPWQRPRTFGAWSAPSGQPPGSFSQSTWPTGRSPTGSRGAPSSSSRRSSRSWRANRLSRRTSGAGR